MNVSQLIPWNRNREGSLARREGDPFFSLQREVNRLFDDMWRDFDMPLMRGGRTLAWPAVEMVEGDKDVMLTVEVPGLSEKDLDVQFVGNAVVIRGERRMERDDGKRMSERYYGRFERRIPLDVEIDADQAKGEVRNGVLTITLPKMPQEQPRTIPVANAA